MTKPRRTLADLRGIAANGEYRRALRQAEYLPLPVGASAGVDGTRSGLERRFVVFCRRHRLPAPEVNVKLGLYVVDFLWRAERVLVETDTFRTHGGAVAFEEDRERDIWLKANGWEVARVTDRRLDADPGGLAAALRSILRQRRETAP